MNLIFSQVRPDRQMLMFSATRPIVMQDLVRNHCSEEPVIIRIGGDTLRARRNITNKDLIIDQRQGLFDPKMCKLTEALVRKSCFNDQGDNKALIFCRTQANLDLVVSSLEEQHEIKAGGMHSNMDQHNECRRLTSSRPLS